MRVIPALIILALLFAQLPALAQVRIIEPRMIKRVKENKTFIVVNNRDSPTAQEVIEVFRQYWTVSEVEIIDRDEIEAHLALEQTYVSLEGFYDMPVNPNSASRGCPYYYLEIWKPRESYLNSRRKRKFDQKHHLTLGKIELMPDDDLYISQMRTIDFGGHECLRNWGPGLLKNYLQQLMKIIQKEESVFWADVDLAGLHELQKDTLYIPESFLIRYDAMKGVAGGVFREEQLLKGYKYPYRIVSEEEINRLILESADPVYYLTYTRVCTRKNIAVTRSTDGQQLYSEFHPISYNIKRKDFNKLNRAIEAPPKKK